jgi:hypothetical protein
MAVRTQIAKILDAVVLEVSVDVIDLQSERSPAPCPIETTPCALIWDAGFLESAPKQVAPHAEAPRRSPDEDLLRCESEMVRAILVSNEVGGI